MRALGAGQAVVLNFFWEAHDADWDKGLALKQPRSHGEGEHALGLVGFGQLDG